MDDALRKRIIALTCDGCRAGWPLDPTRSVPWHRHEYTQEAFGSDWQSVSLVKCSPSFPLAQAIIALVEEVQNPLAEWIPRIVASIDEYPDGGGDISIMEAVTRLLVRHRKAQDVARSRHAICIHGPGVSCIHCIEP